jgi:hypothetical protein
MTAPSAVRAQKKKVLLLCLQIPTEIIEPHPPLQAQQATGSKRDTGRKEFPVLPASSSSSSSSFSLTFFMSCVFPGENRRDVHEVDICGQSCFCFPSFPFLTRNNNNNRFLAEFLFLLVCVLLVLLLTYSLASK